MSLSLIVVSLGALAAVAGTGVLVTWCARSPRAYRVAWALALFGLAVALGSQLVGDLAGYDDLLFRAMELGAQMVAPLALCLGLAELAGRSVQARFGMRLTVAALGVIAVVILGTDPLSLTAPFSKTWPDPTVYYQLWPRGVLDVLASFTFVTAVVAVGVMLARSRHDDDAKAAAGPVAAASAAAALLAVPGLAMIAQLVGVSLPLLGRSVFALACTGAAVLTWFAGRQAARLDRAGARATGDYGRPDPAGRGDRFDQADRARRDFGPESGAGQWENSYQDEADHDWGKPDGEPFDDSGAQARYPGLAALAEEAGQSPGGGRFGDPEGFDQAGNDDRSYRDGDRSYRDGDRYDDWAGSSGDPDRYDDRDWDAGYGEPGEPYGHDRYDSRSDNTSHIELFGQITIYTLIEDRTSEFDRLTERVVAQVKDQEPGTLAYIVHAVPTAPMQRILYEVYRDRVAYDDHRHQPHIARYEIERRPLVLATNVIELGLQQAKVSAFPSFSAISDILSESGIDLTGVTRSSRGAGPATGVPGGRPPGPAPAVPGDRSPGPAAGVPGGRPPGSAPGVPGGRPPGSAPGRPPGPAPQPGGQPRPAPPVPQASPHDSPWSDPRSAAADDPAYQHHYKGWDEIRGEDERYR